MEGLVEGLEENGLQRVAFARRQDRAKAVRLTGKNPLLGKE